MDERLIDDLNLSNRSRNQLHNAGVHTIDDLLKLSEEDIANIRNLGKKSVEEILETVQRYKAHCQHESEQNYANACEWMKSQSAREFIVSFLKLNQIKITELAALSTKAYNLLVFNDLEELYKIIFARKDDLLSMVPRLDNALADEIVMNCHSYLRNHEDQLFEASRFQVQPQEPSFTRRRLQRMNEEDKQKVLSFMRQNDIKLENLSLSVRAENGLRKAGYGFMSDIIFLSDDQLNALQGMGKTSVEEVAGRIDRYLEDVRDRMSAFWKGNTAMLISDEDLRKRILDLYKESAFAGYSFAQIMDLLNLPQEVSEERIRHQLGVMRAEGLIEYVDYRCYRVYPSFEQYLGTFSSISNRNRQFIYQRLNGDTYEQSAQTAGITRERVRQILAKEKKKIRASLLAETGISVFDEDYYSYFIKTYDISCEDAEKWFSIPKRAYHYAFLGDSSKKRIDIHEALNDPQLDIGMRLRVQNYLNRKRLLIDGKWVEKRRSSLEDYLISILCNDEISFDEFADAYNRYLEKNGISYDEKLYYTGDARETRRNRLMESRLVLWKQYGRMRFYDIDNKDYSELLSELDLDSYENTEFSTSMLFRNHPEVIQKYDIRDRFELHNLLKKIIEEGSYHDIHFGRMPTVRFGKFDRNAAILDLLIDNAPIGQNDLVDLINEEFGYEKPTIIGTMLGEFREYSHMGVYYVDQKNLNQERAYALLENLDGDFYYIDEIRNAYMKLYPDADPQDVNPYSLKQIGFNVYSRYALRNYPSLDAYFRTLLRQTQDISGLRKRFAYLQQFSQTFTEMKNSLDIIQFDHNQIITIERLEQAGCTKDDIREFIEDVYDNAKDDAYFNTYKLRQSGFESGLFDLGFQDMFYDSILATDERFSFTRSFNSMILRKKKCEVTIRIFLKDMISQQDYIDSIDLIDQLANDFGLQVPDVSTLVYKLDSTDVYYDAFMDRFYRDKEIYYGEIESSEELFG